MPFYQPPHLVFLCFGMRLCKFKHMAGIRVMGDANNVNFTECICFYLSNVTTISGLFMEDRMS